MSLIPKIHKIICMLGLAKMTERKNNKKQESFHNSLVFCFTHALTFFTFYLI